MSRDEIVHEGRVSFAVPMHRAAMRDARLSWGARGLFAFLWDLPAGWRPNAEHLVGMGVEKKDAVRARLRELQKVGALRLEPIQGDRGTLAGKRWVIVSPERWAREASLRSAGAIADS